MQRRKEKPLTWSAHRYDVALCRRRYFYEYKARTDDGNRISKITPIPEDVAVGSFVHKAMEVMYAGTYKTAESFASAMCGRWKRGIMLSGGKVDDRSIIWLGNDDKERMQRPYILAGAVIKPMLIAAFTEYELGPKPIPEGIEKTLRWESGGHLFTGRTDEIRRLPDGRIMIRDTKTGAFEPRRGTKFGDKYYKTHSEPLFHIEGTRYTAVVDPSFARVLGLSDAERASWKDREYAYAHLGFEYHYLRTGHIVPADTRKPVDWAEVVENVNMFEADIYRERFSPQRGTENCNRCFYSRVCEENRYLPHEGAQNTLFDMNELLPSGSVTRPQTITLPQNYRPARLPFPRAKKPKADDGPKLRL